VFENQPLEGNPPCVIWSAPRQLHAPGINYYIVANKDLWHQTDTYYNAWPADAGRMWSICVYIRWPWVKLVERRARRHMQHCMHALETPLCSLWILRQLDGVASGALLICICSEMICNGPSLICRLHRSPSTICIGFSPLAKLVFNHSLVDMDWNLTKMKCAHTVNTFLKV
jgi:hypothetical protein